MVFKPGWKITAEHFGGSLVLLTIYIDTVDTSYPDEDGVCRRQIRLVRDRFINVAGLDLDGLCFQVLSLAAETDVHENREFLKVRQPDGTWKAPLHPHTTQGEAAWQENLESATSRLARIPF